RRGSREHNSGPRSRELALDDRSGSSSRAYHRRPGANAQKWLLVGRQGGAVGASSAPQVVARGALEVLDDLAALGEKTPRFLSAREEERAEPELVTQAPGADEGPMGDQPPERE